MGGIIPAFQASGQSAYGVIVDMATNKYWNGATMEVYNQAHWSTYVVAMPEDAGSGRYVMTIPALPAASYWISPYLQIAGSPAVGSDTPLDLSRMDWDGGNIVSLVSGANISKINGSAPAAVALAASANTAVIGAAAAGTLTTSQMTTNLAPGNAFANMYAGRVLYFISGVNAGLAVMVTAFAVTGGKLTFIAYGTLPAPSAPSVADTFIII